MIINMAADLDFDFTAFVRRQADYLREQMIRQTLNAKDIAVLVSALGKRHTKFYQQSLIFEQLD